MGADLIYGTEEDVCDDECEDEEEWDLGEF